MNNSYDFFAQVYDDLTNNVDYNKRGAYFHKIMLNNGKNEGILVDLACGTGSLSEYFARLNYDVIGIDCSEDMLSVALQKKMESQSDVIYLNQKMQELDLFGTVDIVICALDSINHITDEKEVQEVFNRVSLFLNEDSLFIFDVNTIFKHQHILNNNTFVYDLENVYCVWQNSNLGNNIIEINLDIFEYDKENDVYYKEQESFCERAYSVEDLSKWLDNAGFDIVNIYAEDSFDAPKEDTQRIVFVAKNRECKNAVG